MPFFIYGPESYTIDKQNTDKIIDKPRLRKETRKLFPGPTDMITEEQKIFVSNEIGEKDRIEPDLLRKILFEKFFFYEIPQYPKRLFNAIKELKRRRSI